MSMKEKDNIFSGLEDLGFSDFLKKKKSKRHRRKKRKKIQNLFYMMPRLPVQYVRMPLVLVL